MNERLLQRSNCLILKANLIEHHDYVALPYNMWRYMLSWYSCDWSIVRYLRQDPVNGVFLDLYPKVLTLNSNLTSELESQNSVFDTQQTSNQKSRSNTTSTAR